MDDELPGRAPGAADRRDFVRRDGEGGSTAVRRPVEFPAFIGLVQDPLQICIAVEPEASDRES